MNDNLTVTIKMIQFQFFYSIKKKLKYEVIGGSIKIYTTNNTRKMLNNTDRKPQVKKVTHIFTNAPLSAILKLELFVESDSGVECVLLSQFKARAFLDYTVFEVTGVYCKAISFGTGFQDVNFEVNCGVGKRRHWVVEPNVEHSWIDNWKFPGQGVDDENFYEFIVCTD